MTRDEFMDEYMALGAVLLDLSVPNAEALHAMEVFSARPDIPKEWKDEALRGARMSLEMRNPGHRPNAPARE